MKTKYFPPTSRFDDTRLYFLYVLTIMLAVTAIAATRIAEIAWRGFRSWRVGVTSGLCFLPFACTFLTLILGHGTWKDQLLTDLAVITICYAIGYCLFLKGRVDVEKTLSESDLRVPQHQRQTNKTELLESDDPIETWAQDALGRAALVDTISIKLMISKTPVLALFGEFGSGKTSILNLLRRNLENKAIVVSFSTWLPGSQETLTSYLLADIATECQKQYIVPGLRKSAERFASALAQSVPFLKGYPELFPAATQRDDIESVRAALSRLPKRVIVLLDELDRMEKNELLTLLKVIRGTATLPNLSFVCASNREAIAETVKGEFNDKSNLYFEKFFPVSVQIPKPDREALCEAGIERLVAVFNGRGWFEHDAELESFRKQINAMWEGRIAPFCHNLRAIGLLANDVGTAAALLRREVHPVDLTLIELLHRFKPSIYEIVEKNFVTLTGGQGLLKGGSYVSDQEKERLKKKLLEDIHKEAGGDEQFQLVTGILKELFPNSLPRFEGSPRPWLTRYGEEESGESTAKRIFHPGIFPAYFR
ncbi:MAG: P-loop NTPase fold protein, partial [Candidatus Sulfotelmatobacter sp.]